MINLINETLIHPHINTKWTVIGEEKGMLECVSEDSVKVEYITKEFGLEMYAEQQKQRADELEKRWSELVDVLNKKYEYYKVRADNESLGPIEQEKWRIAKHEMMIVLMTMAELQENNNA